MAQAKWKRQLPNTITLSRILFVPFIVYFLWINTPLMGLLAACLFILASISDYWDGYFARKYKVESVLGKFMDPISDKILVTSTLVMMIPAREVSPILVILLLSRDALINGLRSVAATKNIIIAAGPLGKWKTAIQMVAIPAVLVEINITGGVTTYWLGIYGLWLSVALSIISGIQYIRLFLKSNNGF